MKNLYSNLILTTKAKAFKFIFFLGIAIFSLIAFQPNAMAQGCTILTTGLNSSSDYISRVEFGGFTNATGSSAGGVTDYSGSISGRLKKGAGIPIRVYVNNGLANGTVNSDKYKVTVYIDWNGDGDFLDSREATNLMWYNNPQGGNYLMTDGNNGFSVVCPFANYTTCTKDMWGLIKVPTLTEIPSVANLKMYVSLIRSSAGTPVTFPCGNVSGLGEVEVYDLQYNTTSYLPPYYSNSVTPSGSTILNVNSGGPQLSFVGLNDINSTIDAGKGYVNDYNYFNMWNSDSTSLVKGVNYDLNIAIRSSWGSVEANTRYKVWMDYNRDGDFLDAGEEIINLTTGAWTAGPNADVKMFINNISIPASATSGVSVMRVSLCPEWNWAGPPSRSTPQHPQYTNDNCQYHDYRVYFKNGCTGSNLVTQGNFNFSYTPSPQASPPNLTTEFSFTGYNYQRFNNASTPKWDRWNGTWTSNQDWNGQGMMTVFQRSDWGHDFVEIQAGKNTIGDWWQTNFFGGHGGGPYLLVNGDNILSSKPWCQNINFAGAGVYLFSYYMANVQSPSVKNDVTLNIPPQISISVDGVGQCIGSTPIPIVENISAQSTGLVWTNIRFTQTITTGTRQVCIDGLGSSSNGNDFALDDISVRLCNTTAEKNAETTLTCVLPIHLLDFGGAMLNPDFIQVKWIATGEEDRTSKYMLYKSADGENWSLIQTTQAKGSGIGTSEYIYLDNTPLVGANYYKLTSIDSYGKVEEFKTIVVMSKKDTEIKKIEIYPTIVSKSNPILNLDHKDAINTSVNISVSNMQGIIVMRQSAEMKVGINSLNISSLHSGYYLLSIETLEGIERFKFYVED